MWTKSYVDIKTHWFGHLQKVVMCICTYIYIYVCIYICIYKCITYKPIAYLLAILHIHETIMVMSLIYRYGMLKPNLWVFALVNSTVQPPSTHQSWANGPGSVARDSTRNFGRWVAARFSGISADQGWKEHGWFVLRSHPHNYPCKMGPRMFHSFSLWRSSFLCWVLGKFGVSSQGMWAKSLICWCYKVDPHGSRSL